VSIKKYAWAVWLAMVMVVAPAAVNAAQNDASNTEITRKVRSKVSPQYPELARKMGLAGVVKIEVVVSPAGDVKDARVAGGHPVLASAALDAVRKWKFEPAGSESSGTVSVRFDPR